MTWIVAPVTEGAAAGLLISPALITPRGEFAGGLYRPVALLTVGGARGSAAGVGATRVAADTRAKAAAGDRRPVQ